MSAFVTLLPALLALVTGAALAAGAVSMPTDAVAVAAPVVKNRDPDTVVLAKKLLEEIGKSVTSQLTRDAALVLRKATSPDSAPAVVNLAGDRPSSHDLKVELKYIIKDLDAPAKRSSVQLAVDVCEFVDRVLATRKVMLDTQVADEFGNIKTAMQAFDAKLGVVVPDQPTPDPQAPASTGSAIAVTINECATLLKDVQMDKATLAEMLIMKANIAKRIRSIPSTPSATTWQANVTKMLKEMSEVCVIWKQLDQNSDKLKASTDITHIDNVRKERINLKTKASENVDMYLSSLAVVVIPVTVTAPAPAPATLAPFGLVWVQVSEAVTKLAEVCKKVTADMAVVTPPPSEAGLWNDVLIAMDSAGKLNRLLYPDGSVFDIPAHSTTSSQSYTDLKDKAARITTYLGGETFTTENGGKHLERVVADIKGVAVAVLSRRT